MPITQRGSVIPASDAVDSDGYGTSLALSSTGAILAVGAPFRDSGTTNGGGVYVYDYTSSWAQRGSVLTAATPALNERFGYGVALSDDGTVMAVGAPGHYEASPERFGGVYLYDYSGGTWTQRGSVLVRGTTLDEFFGASVALSADGTVLAVGAYSNDEDATNAGGVYVFDYSGGVWTQRGSRLVSSGTIGGDNFGIAVALSDNGAILAVGAHLHDLTTNDNKGAVWLFDWSGSAWVERSAKVTASDGADNDYFGSSVALSDSGEILAVGAKQWEGAASNQGQVYLFDWSGTAWTERTTVAAGDAAANDYFGAAVAMSDSGAVLAVGAANWEDATTDQGGAYVFDVVTGDIATAYTSLTVTLSTATASAPTALTVVSRAYAPTSLIVSNPSGIASAPTSLSMIGSGTVSASTMLAVIDATDATNWSARCLIDAVDVSARLVGQASVTAEEGAARIASVSLLPASGVIDPLDYVGKPIVLDYVLVIGGVNVPRRIFTGRVDTPAYDPASTLLRLTCVDDLQNRVAELDRAVIDGLIGGRYTEAVQGELDDNWDYAQALLTTVPASLDAGASGGMRVTPWELATTWATYSESALLYERARLTLPQRSTMVNSVSIAFDYRYPRLRQRYTSVGWSGTQIDMAPAGYQYPTQADIEGAANGTGWTVTTGIFYPAPAAIPHSSGGFIYPEDDAIDLAILYLTQRHSQTVTEAYALTVTAPESVTLNGELPHALRGALESSFDGTAWESALDVAPLMPSGGEQDYAPDAPRVDSDYAIDTLLDQARTKILSTHRGARVGNAILCNPDLDLDKKVAISTAAVDAAGKVAKVVHTLDFSAGSAVSEFEIAIFGAGGAGIITPDTLAPPTPPAEADETQDWPSAILALSVNTYGVTPYTDSLMGLILNPPESIFVENIPPGGTSASYPNPYYVAGSYPVTGFRVQMPGVIDADRNPIVKPVSASYSIIVPDDAMTFTVP